MTQPDTWGFCPDCQRWFYCEGNGAPAESVCPVCWGEPSTFDTESDTGAPEPDQS